MELEEAKGKLKTKLTQLAIHAKRTEQVLSSGTIEAIERHSGALRSTMLKSIKNRRKGRSFRNRFVECRGRMSKADEEVRLLRKWLENRKREDEMTAREDQLKFEMELHERKIKLQADLMQANQRGASSKQTSGKLPNIEIERFEGSFLDWPRFWGQFTETIDKADIASINKLTYLCGLLGSKVKSAVEALPFTSEGYNRAKSILQGRYGKEPEIV